jgi:hypothetical protein
MEFFVFWFVFAIVVAVIASSRGRSGFGWFLLAMIISPLLGVILVALLPSLKPAQGAPTPRTHVKCPDCAELVLKEAKVCKHCGCKLVPGGLNVRPTVPPPLQAPSLPTPPILSPEERAAIREAKRASAIRTFKWICIAVPALALAAYVARAVWIYVR